MSRRGLVLVIWLVILTAIPAWLVTSMQGRLRSDLTLFMPAGVNLEEKVLLDELREGPAGRLLLLGIKGGDARSRARTSRALLDRLSSSGQFSRVMNGAQPLSPDDLRQLFEYRYLLSPKVSASTFSVSALRTALQQRLQDLASPLSSLYSRLIPSDPTGESQVLEQALQPREQPMKVDGVWASVDGSQALLLAETRASNFDIDAQEQAVQTIRKAFTALDQTGQLRLLISGPGAYAVLSRDEIRSESTLLSLAASALVALILYLGYRSVPLIMLSALPVISAMAAGTAAVMLWFGSIHGITLAFGITLLGITIDYPVHLFSHLKPDEDPRIGLRRIWPTLRLGALTTSAAFSMMMTTGFDGLRQLGLFTLAGLVAAALLTRWLLPELVALSTQKRTDQALGNSVSSRTETAAIGLATLKVLNHPATLALLGIALSLGFYGLWVMHDQLWEDDLAALSPIPRFLLDQDRELRRQLNAPEVSRMLIVTADTAEAALQQAEALQPRLQALVDDKVMRDSELVTGFLPSIRTQRQRQAQLPDKVGLQADLQQAMSGLPYKNGTFEPFIEAVQQSRTLPALTPEQTAGTILGLKVASLLHQSGNGWLLMIPLAGVVDPQRLERTFNTDPQSQVRYVDLRTLTQGFISKFRNQALNRLGWGALLMIAILALALRSSRQVVRALLPVGIAVIFDLTLLLALGQRLSLFHLVSLLLVVGISLDYSLFINRPRTTPQELSRTLHSLTVCFASTAAVFGLLALSDLPVLKAIGSTVVIGVTSGYIVSLSLSQGWRTTP
jgi:predicted exporter